MEERSAIINRDSFDLLLKWLDQDLEHAAYKYEVIRLKLIQIFRRRGCSVADELADEVINRVARKVPQISDSYVGDPALYFYGVAQKVFLEYRKKGSYDIASIPTQEAVLNETDVRAECMDRCLQSLSPENFKMITLYYQEGKNRKIDHRKQLADELAIPIDLLRIRVHRIRSALKKCLEECMMEHDS